MSPRSLLVAWMLTIAVGVMALSTPANAVAVGDPAPAFSLVDLVNGQSHSLADYGSHPVLLMFFEYDNETSISFAPQVQSAFFETYANRELVVLGIECKGGSAEQLESFATQTGVDFPILMEGAGTRSTYDLPVNSFVLVGTGGKVRYIASGPDANAYNESAMKAAVETALNEANTTKASTWGRIKNLYK